jgi:TatD DNase family protein
MTELIDTHCHPVLLREEGLLDTAWESCAAEGVTQVIAIGLNVEDSDRNREIAEAHPGVFFTVGWHPQEKTSPDAKQLAALDELLRHPRAVGVGEIGLDYFFRPGYHETTVETQQRSLEMMMELARTHNKPAVIHSRDAHDATVDALKRHPDVGGVMHCFSGDRAFGEACIDAGYVLSFSGIVSFSTAKDIQSAAAAVPATKYLVETDAPFLAPVPMRGKRNLPGYVAHTARAVAKLRDEDFETVALASTTNARRVFSLPSADVIAS